VQIIRNLFHCKPLALPIHARRRIKPSTEHISRKRLTIIPPTYIGFYEEKSHIYSLSPLIRMSLKSNHKREVRRYRLRSEHCFRQENPSLTYALRQTKPSGQVQYNGCCLPLRLCQHRGFHSSRRRKPFYETIKTNSKEPVLNKDLVFQAGRPERGKGESLDRVKESEEVIKFEQSLTQAS